MKKNFTVFHGIVDTAFQARNSAEALNEIGIKTFFITKRKHPFEMRDGYHIFQSNYLLLNLISLMLNLIRNFSKYDVYHYHSSQTLLYSIEIPFQRLLRKKVYSELHGSDLRYLFKQGVYKFAFDSVYNSKKYDSKRMKRKIYTYLNLLFSPRLIFHDYELINYLPDRIRRNRPIFFVPLRINLDKFVFVNHNTKILSRLKIIHAPSDRMIKGTIFIENAIKELQKIYDFDFELIENKDNLMLLEKLYEADIVIDQLLIGSYGVFSIEAMYAQKPVICYIAEENLDHFPIDLPIQNANYENLTYRIEELLLDSELRSRLGSKGKEYVEKYHDSKKIAYLLKDIYSKELRMNCRESFEYVAGINNE